MTLVTLTAPALAEDPVRVFLGPRAVHLRPARHDQHPRSWRSPPSLPLNGHGDLAAHRRARRPRRTRGRGLLACRCPQPRPRDRL